MAKYRYLPRIFRSWVAIDSLAEPALEVGDWEGLQIVYDRVEDAVTAMPLYTSAVEGSRSTKRKKKSDEQKKMMVMQKDYKAAVKEFGQAVAKKDERKFLSRLGGGAKAAQVKFGKGLLVAVASCLLGVALLPF